MTCSDQSRRRLRSLPLKELFGYIGNLRALSQGRAQYSMQFDHYREAVASALAALASA